MSLEQWTLEAAATTTVNLRRKASWSHLSLVRALQSHESQAFSMYRISFQYNLWWSPAVSACGLGFGIGQIFLFIIFCVKDRTVINEFFQSWVILTRRWSLSDTQCLWQQIRVVAEGVWETHCENPNSGDTHTHTNIYFLNVDRSSWEDFLICMECKGSASGTFTILSPPAAIHKPEIVHSHFI